MHFGHDPNAGPRDQVAVDVQGPIYRFSTDSPLRSTVGELEELALFAGQVAGVITDIPTAALRIERIVSEADAILNELKNIGR